MAKTATMETSKGTIVIELFDKEAPKTVANFEKLANSGYYNGVAFHRVIANFMVQGGDPTGSGRGGPGYVYDGEFGGKGKHDKPGILSMANAGPGTDGSQFFLTFVPTEYLNGKHTVFGEVTKGQDTLKALEKSGSSSGQTKEKLEITRATVRVE